MYSSVVLSQEKNIFFKIDSSIAYDSISINRNNVIRYKDVVKLKRKKTTHITVFAGGDKFIFKINSKHIGKFNIIELIESPNISKTDLIISKSHNNILSDVNNMSDKNIQLTINVLEVVLDKDGNIITGNKELDEYIRENFEYFYK